eukprot:Lithocolla_globosa_v1_NODE_1889_length_2271_cov_14.911101.p5 type:complete len:126 gc:universal NODE_1889_length_2271_cov_14.911101:716-339(-)
MVSLNLVLMFKEYSLLVSCFQNRFGTVLEPLLSRSWCMGLQAVVRLPLQQRSVWTANTLLLNLFPPKKWLVSQSYQNPMLFGRSLRTRIARRFLVFSSMTSRDCSTMSALAPGFPISFYKPCWSF